MRNGAVGKLGSLHSARKDLEHERDAVVCWGFFCRTEHASVPCH